MTKTQSPASDLELAPELVSLLEKIHNHTETWVALVAFATTNATDKQLRHLFLAAIAEKDNCNEAWIELLQLAIERKALWLEDYDAVLQNITSIPKAFRMNCIKTMAIAAQHSNNLEHGAWLLQFYLQLNKDVFIVLLQQANEVPKVFSSSAASTTDCALRGLHGCDHRCKYCRAYK